jgi:hypothetical protein
LSGSHFHIASAIRSRLKRRALDMRDCATRGYRLPVLLPDFLAPRAFAPPDFAPPVFAVLFAAELLPADFLPPVEAVAAFAVRVIVLLADLLAPAVARPPRSAAWPARSVALPACFAILRTALEVEVAPLRPVDERPDVLPPERLAPPGRTMSPSEGLTLLTVSAKVSNREPPRLDPRSATSPTTSVARLTTPVPVPASVAVFAMSLAVRCGLLDVCLRLLAIFSPPSVSS